MKKTYCIIALSSGLAMSACGPGDPVVEPVDAGGVDADASVVTPDRDALSPTLWETIRRLSPPGGIEPPADPTNRVADDERAARLGQFLFYETEISGDGTVSCASCHQPDHAFSDPTPLPEEGITGPSNPPGRRTPSLLNVAYNQWYFWDGRVDTLWGQAIAPYESSIEMGGSRLQLARYLYDTPEVRTAYEEIFGKLPDRDTIVPFPDSGRPVSDPSTTEEIAHEQAWRSMTDEGRAQVNLILVNLMKCVAAFEMKLVAVESPFDRFVEQVRAAPTAPEKWDAMSREAQEGMRLFVEVVGCMECHDGPLFANDKFHNLGTPTVAWADPADPGRQGALALAKQYEFSSASQYSDDPEGNKARYLRAVPSERNELGAFRTPMLRNVSQRPPYMHAGQLEDLRATVDFYNEPPDGFPVAGVRDGEIDLLELDETQVDHLVAFLEALSSDPVPDELTRQPASPSL